LIKTVILFSYVAAALLFLSPLGFAAFLLGFLGLRKPMKVCINGIAHLWALFLVKCTGCNLTVAGREHIPGKGGVCFIANHGSIFDIVLALACIGRPFGFIAKKELLFIPLLNLWIYILGGLFIDRRHPRKALETINTGTGLLKQGEGMLIFPEGHRSRGQGLLSFRPGAFKLATQSGVPIVPVAISGSYGVFEENRRVRARPVRVVFCEPIHTAEIPPEDRKQILAERVKAVIQGELAGEGGDSGPAVSG
jgi:1-acyl-sn-glycerol-3-phosphate acyltransferase